MEGDVDLNAGAVVVAPERDADTQHPPGKGRESEEEVNKMKELIRANPEQAKKTVNAMTQFTESEIERIRSNPEAVSKILAISAETAPPATAPVARPAAGAT